MLDVSHKELDVNHNRMVPYLAGAAVVVAAILFAFGVPVASLVPLALVLLVCPVMMFFMMRAMSGSQGEDHTGHGCEHDPTRTDQHPIRPHR